MEPKLGRKLGFNFVNILVHLIGHMTRHVTFSRKYQLFGELVAIFCDILKQKRVLDASQLFLSSHV